MGTIQVTQIQAAIEKRFRKLIDLADTKAKGQQETDIFLTRGLAAFVIATLCRVDDKEAADSVVDEYQDNGIDAVGFDPVDRLCYLVQSKWIKSGTGGIDVGSTLKFKEGIEDFFQNDKEKFGPKMQKKWPQIEEMLLNTQNRFIVVVTHTSTQPLSKEASGPLEETIAKLNEDGELVSFKTLKQDDLWNILAQHSRGKSINLSIMLKHFGTIDEPYKAFYGQIDIKDILAWGEFGDYLYAKNIRGFKGSTEVNEGIISTIRKNPHNFWYFNNGITITATKVTPQAMGSGSRESRVFECQGVSVVNGAQTVGSIISALKDESNGVQNARVLVRIISLEGCPSEFGVEITKAANTQNRVESKDFVSQDPQQNRLHTELFLEGVKYVYRSGDTPPAPDEGCTFDEAAVALACANPDIAYCYQAKREIGKLWEDISKPPYTILFNATTNATYMWCAVQVMRVVEAELKQFQAKHQAKAKLIATHGNRFVLHLVFRSIKDLNPANIESIRADIPRIVEISLTGLIRATQKLYDSSYPSNLFKNLGKCKALAKEISNPHSDPSPQLPLGT